MARPAPDTAGRAALLFLGLLWLCATLAFLQWARGLLIPLAVGVVLAFTLNPVVRRLRRYGVPRVAGAALALCVVWGTGAGLVFGLQDDVAAIAAAAPAAAERLARAMEELRGRALGTLASLRSATQAVERLLSVGPGADSPAAAAQGARPPVRVQVDAPLIRLNAFLWTGSLNLLAFIGQLTVVSFLVFFLLCSGESFKRKLMHAVGGGMARKKATVRLIHDIGTQIQHSLLVLACTNIVVGVVTGLAFRVIGLSNIIVWMVATTFLHFVPYFGAAVLVVVATLVAWLQLGTWPIALLAGLVSLLIATLIGTFLTTAWQSRVSHMDAAAVFIGLLIWGWLWGVWGFLLGMPLLAILKVLCDHVRPLMPIGRFLEAAPPGARRRGRRRRRPAGAPLASGPGLAQSTSAAPR